jgi:NCS1 family nucleobase:cation symporter-1
MHSNEVSRPAESVGSNAGALESRTIDRIPEHERHGSVRSQFTLWMGANLQITAVVDGALAIIFGAELATAITGLLIGNLLGGAVMALHAAQGPRLGLPQMISSRVQFGVRGAALPLLPVILMYLGFAATGTVLSGQAIDLAFGIGAPQVGMVVFGVLTAIVAIVGYKLIHTLGRIATVVGIIGFALLAWRLFANYPVAAAFGGKPFSWATLLLSIALSAGWQLTFAPYVADYSRYLPSKTPTGALFLATFAGTGIGAQLAMSFGALVAASVGPLFIKNQVGFMGELAGARWALLVYLLIVMGKLTVNCLNAYGGLMTLLTIKSAFQTRSKVSQASRILNIIGFVALSVLIAIAASPHFLSAFKNFVLLLLTAFAPWSAINLIDYYLISKEQVDVPALYDPGSRYGAYNRTALASYLFGIGVQIPFLNQSLYQGWFARWMDGTDISWLVGLLATSLFYYPLARRAARAGPGEFP